jgi:parallel beta-helix repeat protein
LKYSRTHFFAAITASCHVFSAHAAEIGPGDDIEAAVAALGPGDELVLAGGTYVFDENISLTAIGSPAQPAVIRARDGERPVLTQATDQQNVVEIRGSSYLVIRGLTFTGGSHGIRLINSHFVTIENCEIFETGDVAISANSGGTYDGLRILRNHIHHTNGTGEGMYLGCNNDACRVANSLIEGNYVHHTNRASVIQGDGIELKEGSYNNVIRDNVIHDTNYPGILVYSTVGNGAANLIEGNVVWNVTDNTVQIAADAVFRNNIVLGNVAMQPHQAGSPSNIGVHHNTIISAGSGLTVRGISGPVRIHNNAIYAQGVAIELISGDRSLVSLSGNVGSGGLTGASAGYVDGDGIGVDMIAAGFSGSPPINPFPAAGGALIASGDPQQVVPVDFNGTSRDGAADVGAYKFDPSGNPGWEISEAFKTVAAKAVPRPPTDLTAD